MKDRKRKSVKKRRSPQPERRGQPAPRSIGGDPDPDWPDAHRAGDEAPGETPEQSVVDDFGAALGVPRAPDEEFRPSAEILQERDRHRREREE